MPEELGLLRELPLEMTELKHLKNISLFENQFFGVIPPTLGINSSLIQIRLYQYLENCTNVASIDLSGNMLTGLIPPELGNLVNLQGLNLSHNHLQVSIPASLNSWKSLSTSILSENHFTGGIPTFWSEFENLLELLIGGNIFGDVIPASIGILQNLNCALNLRNNGLIGQIPSELEKRLKHRAEISAVEGSFSILNKVMEATENLNDQYIVGRGAHGVVYKTLFDLNTVFAVKRLCLEGIQCRTLVYLENRSLHDVLHATNGPPTLEWKVRYKIAIGAAHALAYLHHDCDPAIVHRDIKPENIVLYSEMEPHISNFGIAKFLDQSSASTSSISILGTIGYIAPANLNFSIIGFILYSNLLISFFMKVFSRNAFTTRKSKESDVHSYGVVLLELITRKKPLDPSFLEKPDIVGWVSSVWNNTKEINHIVDSRLIEEFQDFNFQEQVIDVLSFGFGMYQQGTKQQT
ncbi:hypothetical protein Pint_30490 [Pistacia integerrima]|uniref:Uncharacterized protein n=1 Tax=Pistacia integerrima TaxID=434235 RepID=A0ACC0X1V0_9ROSI|nr:hypothetical protein Pint_30490 [Pistacia integerrima]